MTSPVWLDGPLAGQEHQVSPEAIEQGMYRPEQDMNSVYTFTKVMFFDHVVIVGSAARGIPSPDLLFTHLASEQAQRAVEQR